MHVPYIRNINIFLYFDTCSTGIFLFFCGIFRCLQFLSRRVSRPHKADELYRSTSEWLHKHIYGSHLPILSTTEGPSIELEWYSHFIITYIIWIFKISNPILWHIKGNLIMWHFSILKFRSWNFPLYFSQFLNMLHLTFKSTNLPLSL